MPTKIEFLQHLSIEKIVNEISKLINPQVVLWFISPEGLSKTSVNFYRDCFIQPILSKNPSTIFWLMDLSAWQAFKKPNSSINSLSILCELLETFSENIKCMPSARIFKKIQNITEQEIINYFKKALRRDFISQQSKNFPDKNFTVKDIFGDCPIMSDWYEYDVARAYSVFQYFEGCLIIDEIILFHYLKDKMSNNLQIIFTLPNDEFKYYQDPFDSFQMDVEFFISKHCKVLKIEQPNILIKFYSFKYGNKIQSRPYHVHGKPLKITDLSMEFLLGNKNKEKK